MKPWPIMGPWHRSGGCHCLHVLDWGLSSEPKQGRLNSLQLQAKLLLAVDSVCDMAEW